jgi:hypothetical protein
MRKTFVFLLLAPLFAWSQASNVVTATRIVPQFAKILELEKAIAAHHQKFHAGARKIRVFSILTGPDAGGYHITDGPYSWGAIDSMKTDPADQMDVMKNLAPLVQRYSNGYAVYREDLSTIQQTDYTDKIAITHVFPKIGRGNRVEDVLKSVRKTWQEGGQTIAVYESSSSGPFQYILVTRYKQGLKERTQGFRAPFKERHDKAHGQGAFDKLMDAQYENTESSWSEMLVYRPDLSSK